MLNGSYTWSHSLGTMSNLSGQTSDTTWWTFRPGNSVNYGPSPFDHRHSLILFGSYDLPIGRGKYLNINNKLLNHILGNWTVASTNQIISGSQNLLTGGRATFNNLGADGGVQFGPGLNIQELLKRTATMADYTYKTSNSYYAAGTVIKAGEFDHNCRCFHTNVSDLLLNSGATGQVDPKYWQPLSTPGTIGSLIYYTGKTSFSFQLAATKRIRINERTMLTLWAQASNWLNHPFFSQGGFGMTSTTFGNITGASGTRTMLIRGFLDF
jgi:hypothetical protein